VEKFRSLIRICPAFSDPVLWGMIYKSGLIPATASFPAGSRKSSLKLDNQGQLWRTRLEKPRGEGTGPMRAAWRTSAVKKGGEEGLCSRAT
jgi:hypothetical protein